MSGWVNSGKNSASGRNLVECTGTRETIFKDQAMEDCLSTDVKERLRALGDNQFIPYFIFDKNDTDYTNLVTGEPLKGSPNSYPIYIENVDTKSSRYIESQYFPANDLAKQAIRVLGLNQQSITKTQVLTAAAIQAGIIPNPRRNAPIQAPIQAQFQEYIQPPIQPQFQEYIQPQFQEYIQPQFQEYIQPPIQAPIQPQFQEPIQAPVQFNTKRNNKPKAKTQKCTKKYVKKFSKKYDVYYYGDLDDESTSYYKPDDNCPLYKLSDDQTSLIPINQAAINETEAAKKKLAKIGKKSKAQQWNQQQQQQQEWERQQQQQEWERQQQQQEWERQQQQQQWNQSQQQQQQQEWERQQQQQEWERQQQQQEWERQQQQQWNQQQQQQQQQQPQQINSDDHMFTVSRRLGNALQQGKFIAHFDGYDNEIPEFSIKGSFKQSGGKKYRKNKTRKNKLRKNKTRHGRSRKN
jgi:hypothetical protein